ncbi:DUF6785 family protein [Desulfosoma caldarium]|uniref:Uncharacterized protein n=1 Tax=Desulfosoma caldarium TaxID=610254 RepID=A0A3N1UVI2_9BACT|nr:DUF6785 family protein [Desulfosoma caldarium]ROQ93429.1 hypothetical protein EDC27_1446 [Desulfosoma caldarium]
MKGRRLRWSAIALGLLLSMILCALTPYNNVRLQNTPLAGGHFPLASFAVLLFFAAIYNPLARSLHRSAALAAHELLLLWAMVTVATGIAYTGLFRTFLINITTPGWLATTGHPAGKTLTELLPETLFPKQPDVLQLLYQGFESGRNLPWYEVLARIPWAQWATPLALWGLFIGFIYAAFVGLTGLFSHQWIENEKMNFPLLRVPMEISEESERGNLGAYLSHKFFLVGFFIPVMLHLLNGLHTYFPQVPQIPVLFLAQPYIPPEGLLSGFYKVKIYVYPAFIGFAYLTSKQVSFSLWFFFLLGGLLPGLLQVVGWRLPSAALGTTFGPVLARVEEMQMIGAFAVFFFFILWLARSHLMQVFAGLWHRRVEAEEPLKSLVAPRKALILFVLGAGGAVLWMVRFHMDPLPVLLFLGVCFMLHLVTARLICQGGLPYFTLTAAPSDGFLAMMASKTIAPITLALGLAVQKVAFVDVRESLLPSLLHATKAAEGVQTRRRFLIGVVAALFVGVVVSGAAMLVMSFQYGISMLPDDWAVETSRRVHEGAAQLLRYPEEAKTWSMVFAGVGATVMALLVLGYRRFLWWPLHPIGYLTTYSSALRILWFSFLLGWLCNTLVLRYGGVNAFKEVRRLFVGLVVGDTVMAIAWLIVGLFTPVSYHVLPL